jgi:hypothetical protein
MTAMELIESKTLTSAASSIEFINIPQDGTDLVVLVSGRSDSSSASGGALLLVKPNNSSSNGTLRRLQGDGSAASSASDAEIYGRINPSDYTSNTFGSTTIYISNYAGATNKSFSLDAVNENNATTAVQNIIAGLWSSTSAITSLVFTSGVGNFVSGTTASLYKVTKGTDGIVTTTP